MIIQDNPGANPLSFLGGPFGLFGMPGNDILAEIIRRSEQERGREGTPPASENAI